MAALAGSLRRMPGDGLVAASQSLSGGRAAATPGCVRFGEFTLKSGLTIADLPRPAPAGRLPGPAGAGGGAYLPLLQRLTFDRLAALPYAALPIAHGDQPAGRLADDLPAQRGQGVRHAGGDRRRFQPGERVVVIDDLATTGGSKFEAIEKLAAAGLQVQDVVVLIDRQSGRGGSAGRSGLPPARRLHPERSCWITGKRAGACRPSRSLRRGDFSQKRSRLESLKVTGVSHSSAR